MNREQQLAHALDDLHTWVWERIREAEEERRNAGSDVAWATADATCKAFEAMAKRMDGQRAGLQRGEGLR